MSNAALSWAWGVPVSATCKLVLVCLADRADEDGACFPAVSDIVRRTGLAERTVRRDLQTLEQGGMLVRDLRPMRSTVYRLNIKVSGVGAQDAPGARDAPPAQGAPTAQDAGGGCTPCTPQVQDVQGGGAPRAPITLIELSDEPSGESTLSREPLGFAEWWLEYPRKDGKDKARRSYATALKRAGTPAALLRGLRLYPFQTDMRYVPLPATWLNQGRWESAHEAPVIRPAEERGKTAYLQDYWKRAAQ